LEPGSTLAVEGTTSAATFDIYNFTFPPCLTNQDGGEFAEVWYSFNNNGIQNLTMNLVAITNEASFFVDVWENCSTPTDTLIFLDNCLNLNGLTTSIISDTLGLFADTPTDYIMRISTRLISDIPGEFSFQLIGEGPSSTEIPEALDGMLTMIPNPASSFINLKIPLKNSAELNYTIVDIIGQSVLTKNSRKIGGKHMEQIDIELLQPGVYFINLNLDNQPLTFRFVKE